MLANAWTDVWEDPAGPGPLGMPLQNILTVEANAGTARGPTARTSLFAPIGQIVGSMNEVKPVRDVMFRSGRGIHRGHRATRREPRHRPELTRTHDHSGLSPACVSSTPTEGIAGVYASKLLRDLGADVTKVERVGGDPLRRWSAASPDEH